MNAHSVKASRPLLEVNNIRKHYPLGDGFFGRKGFVYAVDDVSFTLHKGETLALVGESGCGKSTVGKAILRLFDLTAGQIVLDGTRIDDLSKGALRPMRPPHAGRLPGPVLQPQTRACGFRDILAEPIRNFGLAKSRAELDATLGDLMERVGLPRDAIGPLAA